MPIKYKIEILPALKEAGFNTTRLRREHLIAEATIQALRENRMISLQNVGRICELLNCQPGDILEYAPDTNKE